MDSLENQDKNTPLYKRPIFWVLLGVFVLFILNAWSYPLFDVDEPRYTETAREMFIKGGDWITPHFNWLKRFDKPAFYYWLIALTFNITGVVAFAGRLVSALAATAIVCGVYSVSHQFVSKKNAIICSLVLATAIEFLMLARWAVTDMTLVCFMSLAAIGLFLGIEKHWRYFLLAGVSAGFGLLTKGPVALALPGLIAILYTLGFARQKWKWLMSWPVYAGVLIAVVIALPWYYLVHMANPGEFFEKFFLLHNVERFRSTVSSHAGPWYYYFVVLAIGGLPWSLLFPVQLYSIKTFWTYLKQQPRQMAWFLFSLTWFVSTFIFFSVAQTKLLTYLLFAFPAYAAVVGIWLSWFVQTAFSQNRQRWLQAFILLPVSLFTLFILAGLAFAIWAFNYPVEQVEKVILLIPVVRELFSPFAVYFVLVLMLYTLITLMVMIVKQQYSKGLNNVFVGLMLIYSVLFVFVLPGVSQLLNQDVVNYALKAKQDGATLATFRLKRPSMVFYSENKVYYLPPKDELDKLPQQTPETLYFSPKPVYLVARTKDLDSLKALYPYQLIKKSYYFSLVQPLDPKALPLRKDVNQ